jgi:hypothetical protein
MRYFAMFILGLTLVSCAHYTKPGASEEEKDRDYVTCQQWAREAEPSEGVISEYIRRQFMQECMVRAGWQKAQASR